MLKIARQKNIDIAQAVAFNYPIAIILSLLFLKPNFQDFEIKNTWYLFVSLGLLLPLIFVIMGRAVQNAGIVKSDAAQRLSLLITLIVAFLVWKEPASVLKICGVGLALIALLFLLKKNEYNYGIKSKLNHNQKLEHKQASFYLIAVWLGYGVIDLLFKLISKTTGNAFSTTLTLAFTIAAILIFMYLLIQKTRFNLPSIVGGIILGLLNFTNIYTYITAHKHLGDSPSVVFTGMNIGVISLGTLIGLIVFKEKLNRSNYIGIGLAIIAILLLFWQMN